MKADAMLAYYAERFGTVEINNTFYRMPKREVVRKWASEVPATFRFTLKMSQRITHDGKLEPESFDSVEYFLGAREELGDRKGPVLVQLPPFLRKDIPKLRAFLAHVAGRAPLAFELGHESFRDEETYALLAEFGAAVVAIDDAKKITPLVATGDFVYLRRRLPEYSEAAFSELLDEIEATGAKAAWVYFRLEDEGIGPKLASRFLEQIAKRK